MAAHVRTVEVPEADRRELQRRARSKGAPARVVVRARIVLLAGDSVPGKQIAEALGVPADFARKCFNEAIAEGLDADAAAAACDLAGARPVR